MNHHGKLLHAACLLLLVLGLLTGCAADREADKPIIGLSMDTLKEERWQKDRDYIVAAAEAAGAEVIVQSANSDDARQLAQCENMLTRGADVLIVIAHNPKIMGAVVEMAHRVGAKVIAYDHFISDSDLDLYVSFDNERVGEMQARYLVERAPEGNYVLIGGDPADHNSHLLRKGQLRVLQPYLNRGDIRIVADQWAREWQPIEALQHVENALTQNRNDVAAIVTSNDGTAGGAVQALTEQGMAGRVLVSGQDAELAACKRVLEGTQSMTVYKPIRKMAEVAVRAAMQMIRGEEVTGITGTVFNGKIDVPSILIEPLMVDANNLVETVVADSFHTMEAVYGDLPRSDWPVRPVRTP